MGASEMRDGDPEAAFRLIAGGRGREVLSCRSEVHLTYAYMTMSAIADTDIQCVQAKDIE